MTGKNIYEKSTTIIRGDRGLRDYTVDKWPRAFEKMLEDEVVYQDIIEYVNSVLSQELARKQDSYDRGRHYMYEYNVGRGLLWYIREQESAQQEKTSLQQSDTKQTDRAVTETDVLSSKVIVAEHKETVGENNFVSTIEGGVKTTEEMTVEIGTDDDNEVKSEVVELQDKSEI